MDPFIYLKTREYVDMGRRWRMQAGSRGKRDKKYHTVVRVLRFHLPLAK